MRTDPSSRPPSANTSGPPETTRLWSIAGMGTELAGGIIGMLLIGLALDWWLGTKPWLTITGATLGLVGGGYNFLRRALKENRDAAARFRASHPAGVAPLPDEPDEPESDDDWNDPDPKDRSW